MILSEPKSVDAVTIETSSFDINEVEQKLTKILSQIDKVGDVSVMITTSGSEKKFYAFNTTESYEAYESDISQKSEQEMVIISPTSGNEQPINIYDIYPEFLGALVVCQGADNPEVKLEILQAIRSLCGISSENITISKMKE